MEKLLIVDGNSLVNRAFYALPLLTNSEGEYSNAVYGFINILVKAIIEIKPTYIAIAFDHARKTFRNEIYEAYKGTRKGMPEELRQQLPLLKEMLTKMHIKQYEVNGIEADDIIGTIAKSYSGETIILSGDRDVLQLIDNSTKVWLTKKGISEVLKLDENACKDFMGVYPNQIIDLKAIMGDSSDNIPGVSGIGEVGAKSLIQKFGSLDKVYENINEISGKMQEKLLTGKQVAYLSYKLATILITCDINFNINECTYDFPFSKTVVELFLKYDFKSLLKREELFEKTASIKPVEIKENRILISTLEQLKNIIKNTKIDYLAFNFLNCIEFAFNDDALYYVGTQRTLFETGELELAEIINELLPILNSSVLKIVYDAKSHYNLDNRLVAMQNYADLSIAFYLINAGEKSHFDTKVAQYNNLWKQYAIEMQNKNMLELYNNIELPLSVVLFNMERDGFKVDKNEINELSLQFTSELKFLTKNIHELCGQEFNINSPKQLSGILFDVLGISDAQNKKRSTGVDFLTAMENNHPVISLILRYRKIQKLNSTYVEVYKNIVEKSGDIIHTLFNQTLTATGRLSSSEPNLQNIPVRDEIGKTLRKLFITRFENGNLISADYNQIELRLLANFSGDKNMINGYTHDADIHRATASLIFNKPKQEITDFERRAAKAVNFGIIYGISAYGLSQNIGCSLKEAKSFIEKYYLTYPEVRGYMQQNVEFAKANGYVKTLFNRIRKIPEINSSNKVIAQFGERVAMNMPLQGTASDIIKIAMIKVFNKLKEENLQSKLILQIHDELIIDSPQSEIERVKVILKECMENVVMLEVPLNIEIEHGSTWFDTK